MSTAVRVTTVTADGLDSDESMYRTLSDALAAIDADCRYIGWERTDLIAGATLLYDRDSLTVCATAHLRMTVSSAEQ